MRWKGEFRSNVIPNFIRIVTSCKPKKWELVIITRFSLTLTLRRVRVKYWKLRLTQHKSSCLPFQKSNLIQIRTSHKLFNTPRKTSNSNVCLSRFKKIFFFSSKNDPECRQHPNFFFNRLKSIIEMHFEFVALDLTLEFGISVFLVRLQTAILEKSGPLKYKVIRKKNKFETFYPI